ncbi:Transposase [Pirellulimonas nuda]|uniref:Transposase n=1 Tax=Pirellulimonas nuda TaxID=2528009 RepID=A0A518DBT9_9BACT|nr:transposase [Pirellulimonas nuda]QDU88945.1 Transposase [Pirellulimonas nuda]
MDEQQEDGRRPRRSYDEAFKRDAVRLVAQEGYTFKAAASLGMSEQSLRAWHAKLVPAPAPCGESASVNELKAENARLRKQLKRVEMEREILKKATAYFAKESL